MTIDRSEGYYWIEVSPMCGPSFRTVGQYEKPSGSHEDDKDSDFLCWDIVGSDVPVRESQVRVIAPIREPADDGKSQNEGDW